MKDIMTELDNTTEILRGKLLDIQEIGYYKKMPWKCIWCGYVVKAEKYPDFASYKKVLDAHSKKCTTEHMEKQIDMIEKELVGKTPEQIIEYFNKQLGELGQ
jgi:hypothetical protein